MATSAGDTADAASATGAAVQGIAGIFVQMAEFKRQAEAIKLMTSAAEKEMQAISIHGEESARTAVQRAYSALADSKFLSEITIANNRFLSEQSEDAIGSTVASAAGAGLDFVGSPVLVAAEISLNANRAVQNQLMTERLGTAKFEFEVDQEMRNVGLARQGAQIAIDATSISRGAQAGAASFDAFRTLTTAANRTSALLSSEGFQSILKNNFSAKPKPAFDVIPEQTPITDGYPI